MKTNLAFYVLLFLLVFLGLGAIGGGGALVISPEGELLGMPLSLLEHSPFSSFLVPGIILFAVLGIAPLLVAIALVRKPEYRFAERFNACADMHWAWAYCLYIAFALMIWIQVQMVFLRAVYWLHTLYMFFGLAILLVALLPQVRNRYTKQR